MKIHFLYGTETGNAEMLCEDIEADLGDGFDCEITSLADITPAELTRDVLYVIVCSTYGSGDVPATARDFSDALDARPDLEGIRFAVFGLGDMVFAETFAQGSDRLMKQMLACKATMIGTRCIHDASVGDMPEDVGLPWFHGILAELNEKAA